MKTGQQKSPSAARRRKIIFAGRKTKIDFDGGGRGIKFPG
jgi:hypothetical protein